MSTSTLPIRAPQDTVPLNEEPDRPQMPGGRIAHVTRARRTTGVFLLLAVVGFGVVVSLAVGSKSIPFATVFRAFTDFDPALTDHLIVRELRLPRTILAVMVGSALGVAGALMQGVTRNPLADPG
ncbi:MAG: iron chelate uptake ABC transporter family permease subunit, partial [Ilumatobacteraceae bacterium]